MAVRRVSGSWVVEFQQRGERVFRRLPPSCGKSEARQLETKLRAQIFDVRDLGHKPEITLDGAIELWLDETLQRKKDQRNPVQNVRYLLPFTHGKNLRDIVEVAQACSKEWSAARTPLALAASTVNQRLNVLKAVAKHSWKAGRSDVNYSGRISLLPVDNRRIVDIRGKEVSLLARMAPTPECRAAIILAAYTGIRAGELLAISRNDISKAGLRVQSKNGPVRTVPIISLVRPYLRGLPLGLSYTQLNWQWREARRRAKLEHVTFHDLRHVCASLLVEAGVDIYIVGEILGHTSTQTTRRYANLSDKAKRAAMDKLE